MKKYLTGNDWEIILNSFNPEENRLYESIMSLGNGRMGIRGNFEEDYSGDMLRGTYLAGIYFPDPTRVGWWKNGYPEYFAKILNSVNFTGIKLKIDHDNIDLSKLKILDFNSVLNMREAYHKREVIFEDSKGRKINLSSKRFLSLSDTEICAIEYSVTPLDFDAKITFTPYLDGDIMNEDANYNEQFWITENTTASEEIISIEMQTKKLGFRVAAAATFTVDNISFTANSLSSEKYCGTEINMAVEANQAVTLYKYIAVITNRYHSSNKLSGIAEKKARSARTIGFNTLFEEHVSKWDGLWEHSDIKIEGDIEAQQGIRFNIFQLHQTYQGDDAQLNIGPKGFTGEKYGGVTYWDTEAYCLPFFISTKSQEVARNLLLYRYNHLEKARENAEKLGLKGALYPMVTINGEECHNEWEITFEEIHRNGAIAFAIFDYVRYTGDISYIPEKGFEVLVEISKFWESRSTYNNFKKKYMILGVTGPNEYENNINNNWYTNRIASWTLEYTISCADLIKNRYPKEAEKLFTALGISTDNLVQWQHIIDNMYYPFIDEYNVFAQQDGYLDKEQILVKDLLPDDLPLNQKWSWDRILRSPFIKQADVLQGLYLLNDRYDIETKRRNFDFYEPRTVHESSLSPCIHSIIASEIGYRKQAYELYLRTSRLDLDNYNNDTDDGLHITSMAGTWMSIVYGFGGMRVKEDMLSFNPFIPEQWESYSFRINYRKNLIQCSVFNNYYEIRLLEGDNLKMQLSDRIFTVTHTEPLKIHM